MTGAAGTPAAPVIFPAERVGPLVAHFRTTQIVIPAQARIHPAVDTGLRRYDEEEVGKFADI